MKRFFLICLVSVFWLGLQAADTGEARLMRFPDIYGNQIVFSYAGDLYLVPSDGGVARRLTSSVGYESFPRFSPDGKYIAFTGQYDGNTEVFRIPSSGGEPQRLTVTATLGRDDIGDRMGPNNIVMDWTPDGKYIVYRSRKQSYNSFVGQLFKVPADGGMSEEIPISKGGFCSFSPDGNRMAFNWVFREFRTWKYYQGGMADDIRIVDFNKGTVIKITDNPHQDIIPMWIGRTIYYLSDRDRTMNLFAYNLDTKETKKVTDFTDYDIKFPGFDRQYVVFEKGGYIYKYDVENGNTAQVHIRIANDIEWSRSEWKDASKMIRSADLSRNGERVLFGARGDIFSVPAKHGITLNLTKSSGVHEREATFSPDGRYMAYLSDQSGEYEIYMRPADGSGTPVQITSNTKTYIFNLAWSPDSKKILFNDKKQTLKYVDIGTKKVTMVDQSDEAPWFSFDWSPDSRWITYTKAEKRMTRIRLYNLETGKSYILTDSWYSSGNPVFSTDGKYILFTSARDFNPIYSQTEWNHAYVDMSRIYMILLSKDTPSPFAPENDVIEVNNVKPTARAPEKSKPGNKKKSTSETKDTGKIIIDIDGINERVVGLPVKPSNYFGINGVNDKVYFLERSSTGRDGARFAFFDLKKKKETELGQGMSYGLSANHKKMLVRQKNRYAVINLPSSKISLEETVDLSGMKVKVDLHAEWKQIFNESWRQMRDFFYAPNMHGVDWPAMHDKYAVLLPYVNHRSDLTYIIGEMVGELSIGHSYVINGEAPKPERIALGLLGAKVSRTPEGWFRIDHILPGANWSRQLRSPLTEIGVNVKEGDYILAVNGRNVKEKTDIFKTLIGQAGKTVELTVNNQPDMNGSRNVLVRPLRDESALYYYEWVENNIRKVSEATDGKVGYIHIPDMGVDGLNEFVKHYYPQLQKKGLIIDVRGNGGGNVSPMIIERLMRTITYMTMHTGEKQGDPNPVGTFVGPKVTLLDKYSASDGDLFPYRFKYKKLGKLIGTRSWGGVVGYSGSISLIDGGSLITPSYAPYAADGSGWIIEGHGVDPDIFIENDPVREYKGIDDQLNKAIEVIKDELRKNPPKLPSIPPFPDKSGKK
ncbi:MAG: protease [Chlorobi bacterium]|nr:protease [Chlorobiota bacterium]